MMKARIKADDDKQQKEEFQATSKKQIETKNGKQEPLLTLSSRERKREQSNKKEDIRFSRITSRSYKDTPELRLDYNFRWLRGSWGIVKVFETKGRKRRGLARTTWRERRNFGDISREEKWWGRRIVFSLSLFSFLEALKAPEKRWKETSGVFVHGEGDNGGREESLSDYAIHGRERIELTRN